LLDLSSYEELAEVFDLRNLLGETQAKKPSSKGDLFDRAAARESWIELGSELPPNTLLLCAGRAVAKIVGVGHQAWFESGIMHNHRGRFEVVVIPHPSGISHWWNDPEHVSEARDFLRSVITH